MPRQIVVVRSRVTEGGDVFLTNRHLMADNTALEQADVSSGELINLNVYDMSGAGEGRTPGTAIFTKTDIPLSTIQASNQTDGYWDGKDGTGYNWRYQLVWDSAGSNGPYLRGGHTYVCEFSVVTDSFGTLRWKHILDVDTGKTV